MKNKNARGLFDEDFRLERLTKLNDPLIRLNKYIDWEVFRPILDKALVNIDKNPKKGGRPPFDNLFMFKTVVLQSIYNVSDDQLEYQINDRLSFMRFLDLGLNDKVPDSKTIWSFRQKLVDQGIVRKLFNKFNSLLDAKGIIAYEGSMVDASFVHVPRQRNTRDENKQVKSGQTPKEWALNTNKLSQKDLDARWTKKNNVSYYGYKNHIKADTKSKLILDYVVTSASVHDSQMLEEMLDSKDKGQELYADSAYAGQKDVLKKKKMKNRVHEKGVRGRALTKKQQTSNRVKSTVRARVEHIFGFIENSLNGAYVRTIGEGRADTKIGMMNLVYNLSRCVQLKQRIAMG